MVEKYLKAMDWIYRFCIWIAGFALIAMTLIYMVAIYTRHRNDFPSFLDFMPSPSGSWPEQASVFCMRTFSFVGAAAAYRAGGHIAISILVDKLPDAGKLIVSRFIDLCMLGVAVFIIYAGYSVCAQAWHDYVPSLPWVSAGFLYTPIVLGSILTLVFIIEHLLIGPQNHREIVKFGSPSAGH